MFSFLGGSSTLLAGRHDPGKERPPPPLPTEISFPNVEAWSTQSNIGRTWTEHSKPDLFHDFGRIRKLGDVTPQYLESLNVSIQNIKSIEDLFSSNSIAASFLPPQSWLENPEPELISPIQSRVLDNGRPYPTRQEFFIRSKELKYDNDSAFRALTRTPRDGQPSPRLAHFRRFWEALDNMAYYWDVMNEQYIPPKPDSEQDEEMIDADALSGNTTAEADEAREQTRPNPVEEHSKRSFLHSVGNPVPPKASPDVKSLRQRGDRKSKSAREDEAPIPPGTYKGNRIGNGSSMPESYRVDAARAFVEPIAWAFGFTLAAHRKPPVLHIKSLLVPIKLSGTVWRPPKQREKARMGHLQGPVMGISCRAETGFAEAKSDPVLDVLREIGALLCLAQERAREGKKEVKPGEGKWWTQVPRWGGGPGGETGEAFASKAEDALATEGAEEKLVRGRPTRRGNTHGKKLGVANAWKTLRIGIGYWDSRTEYLAVGKVPGSEWDEVFLVSSLNHHISVLKLRVHGAYLHFLNTSELPINTVDENWAHPVLQRTRWYDLFNNEDRMEALRLVWGAMGYLARAE